MYKLLLILKYLRKRRIAWVSLIAVTLCTALVLVVISVMGGWLRMFRQSFHGLAGDVMVKSDGMAGFPHYEEMLQQIEALPGVGPGNAVPVIQTFGLINIGNLRMMGVQVFGYPLDKIGNVNTFPQSLYRQYLSREDASRRAMDKKLTEPEQAYWARRAKDPVLPPSFELRTWTFVGLDRLPPGVTLSDDPKARIGYDPQKKILICRGVMTDEQRKALGAQSDDTSFRQALSDLQYKSEHEVIDYQAEFPKDKRVLERPGMVVGTGVVGIGKGSSGEVEGRAYGLFTIPVRLTVLGITPGDFTISAENKSESVYFFVDDSRTKVYQYDAKSVYVPFEVLQRDLNMTAQDLGDGQRSAARTTEIDIRVKPGHDLNEVKRKVEAIVGHVLSAHRREPHSGVYVETWEESNKVWLGAIEKEKLLVTFLFGMISIVAVFLIFCIFYMIVVEKTRDIGIIKSVGATSAGVAQIFLGYGLTIGVLGSGLGFAAGWLIVHYINQIHSWLGQQFGMVIWDPEVYAFDTIPNTMNPREVAVILIVAVVSAVGGAVAPAISAGRKQPIEALRWE